jgi:hypothetical protein
VGSSLKIEEMLITSTFNKEKKLIPILQRSYPILNKNNPLFGSGFAKK